MQRIVGQLPGPRGAATLDLSGPELDFAAIAGGMGVDSVRGAHGGRAAGRPGPTR